MENFVIKQAKPGDILSEYDTIEEKFLGRYVILEKFHNGFSVYCMYDITQFFKQGSVIIIGHHEIEKNERYVWTIGQNEV